MSWWTSFRDDVETAAALVSNYFYPGSGAIGEMFINSKGSQAQLGSTWGQLAMLGTGLGGAYEGNMANYGATWDAATGAGGTAAGSGISGTSTIGGQSASTGFTGAATLQADPGAVNAAQSMIQQGVAPDQAIQMAGLSPQQADMAGLPAGAGQTWQDVAAQSGIPYGGQLGGGGVGGGGSAAPSANLGPAAQQARAVGAAPWGSAPSNMSVGSGIFGLLESQRMQQAALAAQKAADPFASQRGYYADQLRQIQADPNAITKIPGYQAGQQAIERSMAAQGYTGSGNMMAAMQKYGGDFYNQTMAQYAQLAGAGANPAAAAQLGLQGQQYGVQLAGQSLGSLGYAAGMANYNPYAYGQQQQQNPYAIYQGGRGVGG